MNVIKTVAALVVLFSVYSNANAIEPLKCVPSKDVIVKNGAVTSVTDIVSPKVFQIVVDKKANTITVSIIEAGHQTVLPFIKTEDSTRSNGDQYKEFVFHFNNYEARLAYNLTRNNFQFMKETTVYNASMIEISECDVI